MLSSYDLFDLVVDTVPQWFIANDYAPHDIPFEINGNKFYISALRNATPSLYKWKINCEKMSEELLSSNSTGSRKIDREIIQSKLVEEWLTISGYEANWSELFDYNRILETRTYENSTVGFTFVYSKSEEGQFKVLESGNHQKILDVLSESQYTYFKLGENWTYLNYDLVLHNQILDKTSYNLAPEFLYPYQSILQHKECAITKTKRGDLIIYDKYGLLASNRKGEWKIYDASALKNTFVDIAGDYNIGCNLFGILFDLSYRRHGALIVVDNLGNYKDYISNNTSFLDSEGSDFHQTMSSRLENISLKTVNPSVVSKQLILELASVDGALILGMDGKIKAFGAIIKNHPRANNEIGARSTAGLSAHYYGMKVFKVSSDGEITMYFNNNGPFTETELIKMKVL